jgi:histidinol-phosphate aminotransferase
MIKSSKTLNNLEIYKNAKQAIWESSEKQIFKLDWNEEKLHNSKVYEKILEFITTGNYSYYPDTTTKLLSKKISEVYNLEYSDILVYNGSDTALDDICKSFLDNGDIVSYIHPEYSNFDVFVSSAGGIIERYLPQNPFEYNLNGFYNFIKTISPKMIYISNPNNPTGSYYSFYELSNLVRDNKDVLFIIDEAYINFICNPNEEKLWLENYVSFDNVLIVRTFSKLFSLAGLRVGYVIGNKNLLAILNKIRKAKNITMLGQIAATEALNQISFYIEKALEIKKQKEIFILSMKKLSFIDNVYSSEGNFVCIKINKSRELFLNYLEKNSIFVRDRSGIIGLDNIIRVTITDDMSVPIRIIENYKY